MTGKVQLVPQQISTLLRFLPKLMAKAVDILEFLASRPLGYRWQVRLFIGPPVEEMIEAIVREWFHKTGTNCFQFEMLGAVTAEN